MTHEVTIDGCCRRATFGNRPHDKRLAATCITRNEHAIDIRCEFSIARDVAAIVEFDAKLIHTHTFPLEDLPTAIRYAKDRVEDAIKVVVKAKMSAAHKTAAE